MAHVYRVTVTDDKGKTTELECGTYRAVKDMWKEPLRLGHTVTAQRIEIAKPEAAPAAEPTQAASAAKTAAKGKGKARAKKAA